MSRLSRLSRLSRYFYLMSTFFENRIPGVVKVEYFDLMQLESERIDLDALIGIFPNLPKERFEIPVIEPGTCESTWSNGAESCSLSFSSNIKIRPKFRPGFIFTDANNDVYMIASSCKPFPKIDIVRTFGKMPEERPEYRYTIKHAAVETPVRVKES